MSHANPEDNAFATWLTLRLTREGYRVWCDVVKLRGGDDFWKNIEAAIRLRTRRFIFVTSRISNQKPGALKELAVAEGVARALGEDRFIVPIKIDDLPYNEHNIQINRLNALDFANGWATGLAELLKALRDDSIPTPETAGASCVASWWNTNRLNHEIVEHKPETLWTNWFPLRKPPSRMWVWRIPEDAKLPQSFRYPTHRVRHFLLSFADGEALLGHPGSPTGMKGKSFPFSLRSYPPPWAGVYQHEVKTAFKKIMWQTWESLALARGLPLYELSSRRRSLWFPGRALNGDMVAFNGVDGRRSRRALAGYKTTKQPTGEIRKRYWHFGLEAIPILYPTPALSMKTHVVFTRDGETPLGDPKGQHRARRSQCKAWWNDKWRDMTLAAVTWLANGEDEIALPVSPTCSIMMSVRPICGRSPVSYQDISVRESPDEATQTAEDFDDFTEEDETESIDSAVPSADSD
ncbi:MAG: toll/interleukin-1 receptor domain-containing protein [Phycisphaeraceae bacterium]|nr:toll/interleukin-1 receptor domain-containing protein [Phycisphaeraceae bacterium]